MVQFHICFQPNRGQRPHQHRNRSNHHRRSATNRDGGDPAALNGASGVSPAHQATAPSTSAAVGGGAAPVEPPPPYTERAPPAVYGGGGASAQASGPPRGHRKRKHRENPSNRADLVEMRAKRV